MTDSTGSAARAGGNTLLLAFLAWAIFSLGDSSVKGIGSRMSPFETAFFFTLFSGFVIVVLKERTMSWASIFSFNRPGLLFVRSIFGTVALPFGVYAFTNIPLAEAYSIIFVGPVITMTASALLLKEYPSRRQMIAAAIGIVGVLIVLRPGFRDLELGHLSAACVALCVSGMLISTRALGSSERPVTMMTMLTAVGLAFYGVTMFTQPVLAPDMREWGLLAVAGVCGGIGQIFLMAASRKLPASLLAPTQYTQLAWAILYGFVFFREVPDMLTFVGVAVIGLSGLLLMSKAQGAPAPAAA
jgi:drug/metabolite transporter (DMT)-like permease